MFFNLSQYLFHFKINYLYALLSRDFRILLILKDETIDHVQPSMLYTALSVEG